MDVWQDGEGGDGGLGDGEEEDRGGAVPSRKTRHHVGW